MIDAAETGLSAIATALSRIAPPGVTVGAAQIDALHRSALTEAEWDHVRGAVPSRIDEFATGRALLRRLLGIDVEIPVLPNRAPALPHGHVGSLAHDDEVAVAAVAAAVEVRALGIDVERAGGLSSDEAEVVVRADEKGLDPRLAFVLKEAAYKTWSARNPGILDFHDVRLDVGADRFEATVVIDGARPGPVLHGAYTECGARLLALVVDDRH